MGIAEVLTVTVFFVILAAAALEDIRKQRIDNRYPAAVLVLVVISIFTMRDLGWTERILGMACVSVPMLFLDVLKPGSFGGGDIKLVFACGGFLGMRRIVAAAIFAVLLGGVYAIWSLTVKKKSRKEKFAFGPFLCIGMMAAQFFGKGFWEWLV